MESAVLVPMPSRSDRARLDPCRPIGERRKAILNYKSGTPPTAPAFGMRIEMPATALLLNASYEPLHVITVRRAVVLVLAGKADVVSEGEGSLHSARVTVPVPSVIRLRYYVKVPYRAHLPLTRRNVVVRDRGRCAYCGRKGDTVDHVVPRSRGGTHTWDNVVAACAPCNGRKADKNLDELGWSLAFTPRAPSGWSWLVVGVTSAPDWEPWLANGSAAAVA